MIEKIRLAELDDTDSIVELLNRVTLNLHKKGINQWNYPWKSIDIEKDIKNRNVYVLMGGESIAGTFTIRDISDNTMQFAQPNSKYLCRIAVASEYQRLGFGITIVNYSCHCAKEQNKALYLECWAGNEKLKAFYSGAGLDYIGDFPESDYMISAFKYK